MMCNVNSKYSLLIVACLVASGFALSPNVVAQELMPISSGTTTCSIRIKMLEGMAAKEEGGESTNRAGANAMVDESSQLEALPFSDYRIVSSGEQSVELNEEANFQIKGPMGEAHSLSVTPIDLISPKVRLGLMWQGPHGETILHTQLGVANGKNIVVGSDGEVGEVGDKHPTVVSIRVQCS